MLIKNAKKQIPVTTFTTTVKVEAACKVKQVTYNNVIWVSKNKNWVLYEHSIYGIVIQNVTNCFTLDVPVLLSSGAVLYDDKEQLPKYVKQQVSKILNKYFN